MPVTLKASELTGDPQKGAQIFKEHCAGCHNISKDMKHKYGPNLYGVWGRPASSLPDFKFKEPQKANQKEKGRIWDETTLTKYLTQTHIPGTKMKFKFLHNNEQGQADLVAYIKDATKPTSSE